MMRTLTILGFFALAAFVAAILIHSSPDKSNYITWS